jgi:hypothetical protein
VAAEGNVWRYRYAGITRDVDKRATKVIRRCGVLLRKGKIFPCISFVHTLHPPRKITSRDRFEETRNEETGDAFFSLIRLPRFVRLTAATRSLFGIAVRPTASDRWTNNTAM